MIECVFHFCLVGAGPTCEAPHPITDLTYLPVGSSKTTIFHVTLSLCFGQGNVGIRSSQGDGVQDLPCCTKPISFAEDLCLTRKSRASNTLVNLRFISCSSLSI